MSILSWLGDLLNPVRKFFKKLAPELKTALHWGVVITDNLKMFVDSPLADIVTAIIPGGVDDLIKDRLRTALPVILGKLRLVERWQSKPLNTIMAEAIEELKMMDGDFKKAYLHDLAILIAQVASDDKLSWSDGAKVIEWYYQHEYTPAVAVAA